MSLEQLEIAISKTISKHELKYYNNFRVFIDNVVEAHPVGSLVTCMPPPKDTDEDYLVLMKYYIPSILDKLGFTLEGSQHYEPSKGTFNSWRKKDVNLIVTNDENFFKNFLAATSVAKRLNLLHKDDRIALFKAVLYGEVCEDVS